MEGTCDLRSQACESADEGLAMTVERERITRSKANRKVVAAAKEWLLPLGFKSIGTSSECVFRRWQDDRYQSIVIDALAYNSVELRTLGRMGFVSAERIFDHFSTNPLVPDDTNPPLAFGLSLDYVQLTRDTFGGTIRWTYVDEEAEVLRRVQDVVMNFIYATMESIQTPDDLIDLQVAKIGETDKFTIGRLDRSDNALRLLTLVRLYRPSIYLRVRSQLQDLLEKSLGGPFEPHVQRQLAYLDQPGPLPPLPDPSEWKR
jgi:hypothetical protein